MEYSFKIRLQNLVKLGIFSIFEFLFQEIEEIYENCP